MINLNYNIKGENVTHRFPKYYECDKSWFSKAELKTKDFFINTIREDFTIIDAGAQIGMYSVLFSKLTPKGKIYAFEPTDTMDFLIDNLNENGVTNVEIHKTPLSNKVGTFTDKIFKVWSQQIIDEKEFEFETIDNFVKTNNLKIDLLKIDVDSYDYEVLQGSEEVLKTQNPIVVVELNHALGKRNFTIQQAVDFMNSLNYKVVSILDTDNYIFEKK